MDTASGSEKMLCPPSRTEEVGRPAEREAAQLVSETGLVVARGTGQGLVLRLDGRQGLQALEDELRDFLMARRTFVAGHEVILEWLSELASEETGARIQEVVLRDFDVRVRTSRVYSGSSASSIGVVDGRPSVKEKVFASARHEPSIEPPNEMPMPSLFSGVDDFDSGGQGVVREVVEGGGPLWDDPNAKVVCATLRSGQRIESEHSVVVVGDVNSGAEIVAGGHVVVLGSLRGLAHAGAFEESEGSAFIFALNLQPTQLRIGSVISRSSGRSGSADAGPEIARVDGDLIVVEKYHPRLIMHRGIRALS